MPEGANVDIAHSLTESHDHHETRTHERWHRVLEIFEVFLLAIVAIATAWSGFQAAKWDGRQSFDYGTASRLRFEADAASTAGGQELIADVGLFTAWLEAHDAGDEELQFLFEKRMTPDYRVAFEAWMKTDPFNNPNAPVGPAAMAEYKNPYNERAAHLNDQASASFDDGTDARETGEKYVRNTVLFAMVLFLVAIAQRFKDFKDRTLRTAENVIALTVLVFALSSIATLPRIT
jgi:hypothetical protein